MMGSNMQCREVRELADVYLDDELLVESNHALLAHLRTCATCEAELQARRALRAKLSRAFVNDAALAPAPAFTAGLVDRLHATATERRVPMFRRYLPWMAAAAVVVAFAWLWGLRSGRPARLADDPAMTPLMESAAADHRDCALRHQPQEPPIALDRAALGDPALRGLDETVRRSATARFGSDAKQIGAHACKWGGRQFGHVVLDYRAVVVSVLVTAPESDLSPYVNAAPVGCPTQLGFSVACFAAPQHAVFVVSELPSAETLTLTQAVAPDLRAHLSRTVAGLIQLFQLAKR